MPNLVEVPSIDCLLRCIGPFSMEPILEQGDTTIEKEQWLRKRFAVLRTLIDNYPGNKWVIECLREYQRWMHLQPSLFVHVQDTFDQALYEPTGLYRDNDTTTLDARELDRDRRAIQVVRDQELQLADHFLSCHPDSTGVAWAHNVRLEELERRLYQLYDSNPTGVPDTRDEILIEASEYCAFLARSNPICNNETIADSIEYFSSVAVEILLEGVESFKPDEGANQISYLEEICELFPNNETALAMLAKLESLGQPFELAFEDIVSGKHIDIRQFRGSVVLIVFWATWCQPCLQHIPFLKSFRDAHRDRGLEIIGVSADGHQQRKHVTSSQKIDSIILEENHAVKQRVRSVAVEHGIDWPIFVDDEFHRHWLVTSIPRTFVVDQKGNLCWTAQDGSVYNFASRLLKTRLNCS